MKEKWLYYNTGLNTGQYNMKRDVELLDNAIREKTGPILRIYGWKPVAVTLGCNQKPETINIEYCASESIDIVKRPTGGRAVLHQGDITYSFIINSELLTKGENVANSYKEISSALIKGFENLGIAGVYIAQSGIPYTKSAACMAISTGADLEYETKKIAGSAQLRKSGYILQHGSILVNQDFPLAARIFNVPVESMNCINVAEISGREPGFEVLAKSIRIGFEEHFNISFQEKQV